MREDFLTNRKEVTMRSFQNFQPAHIKQTVKATLIALTFMLVLLGSVLSLSAFTLAPSVSAQNPSKVSAFPLTPSRIDRLIPATCKPSFPSDAVFTWYNSLYQAWIRPIEGSDKHFNFAIQPCGGGGYYINAHVRYIGNKLWQTYDEVSGETKTWGDSSHLLCSSWTIATQGVTAYVAYKIGTGSDDLYNKSYYTVGVLMDKQIGGVC